MTYYSCWKKSIEERSKEVALQKKLELKEKLTKELVTKAEFYGEIGLLRHEIQTLKMGLEAKIEKEILRLGRKFTMESTPNMDRISELRKLLGENFTILSGDDSLTLPMMALGAKGVISVANNIMPREVKAMVDYALKGDFQRAREIHYYLYELFKVLFIETNPIPVKTACWALGMCEKEFRLPLCPMKPENEKKLIQTLRAYNLPVVKDG